MAENPLEKLRLLSDKIQDEEMSIIINQMAEALLHNGDEELEERDLRKETEREKCASVFLRSMRIHLCLDLLRQGHSSCAAQFRADWDQVIDCMKFMEYEWDVTNEVLCDAVDAVLLLDPGKRKTLIRQLDFATRLKIKPRKPLPPPVADCAFQMVDYCFRTERVNEMLQIISSLIALSQERNIAAPDKHRAITAYGLYYTVDNDPQLTLEICDAQKRYFETDNSIWACRFWWYYANALLGSERKEDAQAILKCCHDLYIAVEGENSWIGARAGALYHQQMLSSGSAERSEKYLWDVLKKIDSNFYSKMDHTADYVAASVRGAILHKRMNDQTLRGLLPEIQRFRAFCAENEGLYRTSALTVRHAENILAGYYLENGDYLLAADHTQNALNAIPPEGMEKWPTDVILYSNLLLIHINLNNVGQIGRYMQKLSDLYPEYEDDDATCTRVYQLFNTARKKVKFETAGEAADDLEEARQQIRDFYRCIRAGEVESTDSDFENSNYAQLILELCSTVLDSFTAERKELIRLRRIVNYFLERPGIYKFTDVQKCTCYTFLTQIEWQLGSDEALVHVQKCLHYARSLDASREVRITIMRFAASTFFHYNRLDEARAVVEEVFSGITAAWQKATAYLNDKRVCQLLNFIRQDFSLCFGILRTCATDQEIYERVLQFKDLPALVGRERNKLLRLAPVDEHLKQQIFAKQDQLAEAELSDALNGTTHAQALAAELEHLEAKFAAQFPRNLFFTEISFSKVCEKLPDRSAIVEYYISPGTAASTNGIHGIEVLELDIFVTAKRNGRATLVHLNPERCDLILTQALEFIHILQNPGDPFIADEKENLRSALYRSLIAPVMPFLDGITDLYLAPDSDLCNLPFEILHADGSGILQDHFKLCRLVCGRDLLFFDSHTSASGSCFILGDPDYESQRGEIINDHTRSAKISLEPMQDLPFSGIEAARIGQRCRSRIYSGHAATKYALQNALPCSIIHLATHGVFDREMETDSLYSSHLVFAGYNKWVTDRTESQFCGNGILTADEISRMDLKKTELVVLSACLSGLGDTSYGSVRGLLSAFSAAGSRWIISHMWEANDFSTAVLMDAFYDALRNKGYDVPAALQYAKHYLKNATIDTLNRNGWLELPDNGRFSDVTIREIREMHTLPQDDRPFEDEFYWGGFTVHKSR